MRSKEVVRDSLRANHEHDEQKGFESPFESSFLQISVIREERHHFSYQTWVDS